MAKYEDKDEWLRRELGDTGPARSARPPRKSSGHEESPASGAIPARKKRGRILVVEDDPMMIELYRAVLKEEFNLHFSTTGEEALVALEDFHPDLLILDNILPGMTGIDVCCRIRNRHEFDSIKIIMVSGQTSLADRIDGFRAGADDFLLKPIKPDDFIAKMRASFEWKREAVRPMAAPGKDINTQMVNCWEYMKCGRKDCPVYLKNSGRLCWLVAGTMCGGKVSGTRAQKLKSCMECEFFRLIKSSG